MRHVRVPIFGLNVILIDWYCARLFHLAWNLL